MKRKCKAFIALIAALLIVATLCAALVACNGNDDKTKPDETPGGETPTPGETTDGFSDIVSDEELDSLIAFAVTEGRKSGHSAEFGISYYADSKMVFGYDYSSAFGTHYLYMMIGAYTGYTGVGRDENNLDIYIMDSASAAQAVCDYMGDEAADATVEGNKIFIGNKDIYTQAMSAGPIPSEFSKTRLDFIKNVARIKATTMTYLWLSIGTDCMRYGDEIETWESFDANVNYPSSNCDHAYNFRKISPDEVMTDDEIAAELAEYNYTDDSYFDYTRESGYMFDELTDKTGIRYENCTYTDIYNGTETSGIEAKRYYYDKNSPKNLVVPAEVNGQKVVSVAMNDWEDFWGSGFETITLSDGILAWTGFYGCPCLVSISLPASIQTLPKFGPFGDCDKFTTIKYAGTTDEWNALAEANDVDIDDWCRYEVGDYDDLSYEYRSFTVQCKNGSITYPTSGTPGGETPTPGEDKTTGIAKVFSREQFNALVGYAYSLKFESNVDASVMIYFETYSAEELAEQAESTSSHAEEFKIMRNDFGAAIAEVMYTCGETEIDFAMYYLDTPERAQTLKNILGSQAKVVGNIVVILAGGNASEFYTFENEIANATLPASLSTERKNFYGEAYDRILTCKSSECYVMGSAADSADSNGAYAFVDTYSSFTFAPQKGNREETIYFSRYFTQDDKNALLEDKESFLEQPFTDDSYFDMDREDSFAYVYYKMSPGFVYEVIGDGDYYEECRNKLCVTDYYYDEMPAEVVIPDQIDGVEVVKVELSGYGFQSLVLPEGLITLRLTDDVIDHITLPATVQFAELNCKAIKTITVKPFSGAIDKRLDILLNGNDALETIYFEGEKQYFKDHLAFMFNNYNIKNRNVDIVCEDGTLFCDEDGVVKDKQTA